MRPAISIDRLERLYERIAPGYDLRHALLTARADRRGRRMLVAAAVRPGDSVLDCGAGTGSTALLAAKAAGPDGAVTLFDLSEGMLAVARDRAARLGLADRLAFRAGDMARLPFADNSFDVVLSTYSLCPLYDPAAGAREMLRVARPGGRVGAAHSTLPRGRVMRRLAERVEDVAWRFPSLSMGCRAVEVLPALEAAGARMVLKRRIGVPLWPFLVFVVEKPAA